MAIGFMLFDPSSTVETVRENLTFLQAVGEDGYFPINFCKMIPYAGTPIEAQLRQAGRLKGTVTRPNYGYRDPQLDVFESLINEIFSRRNYTRDGIVAALESAHFSYHLARAFGHAQLSQSWWPTLQQLTSRSNQQAVQTAGTLLDNLVAHGPDYLLDDPETLVELAGQQWRGDMEIDVLLKKHNIAFNAGGTA
jgi:hypothetical protein